MMNSLIIDETHSDFTDFPGQNPHILWTKSYLNVPLCMVGGKKKPKSFPLQKFGVCALLASCSVHRLSFCVKWISREFLQCYNTTSSTIVKYNYRTGGSYCWSLMTKYILTWKTSEFARHRYICKSDSSLVWNIWLDLQYLKLYYIWLYVHT